MKNFGLDFVAQHPAVRPAGAALLLAGAVAMGFSVQQYFVLHQDIADLTQNLGAAAAGARRARGEPSPDAEQLRARIQLANQVVQSRTIPWDTLFRDIEAASTKDIAVLSVEPDAPGRTLRITGEARNAAALTEYIERLEKQPSLDEVHLTEHELREEPGRAPLRFGLHAIWVTQ